MTSPLALPAGSGPAAAAAPAHRPSASALATAALATVLALASLSAVDAAHQRVYMIGNSLTDDVRYDGFANLVTAGGHTLTLGSQRIPGAPVRWLWQNPDSGYTHSPFGTYPSALGGYTWDALTLQPFSDYANELSHARYFARALRGDGTFGPNPSVPPQSGQATGRSPGAMVHIYAQWPGGMLAGWNSPLWLGTDPAVRDHAIYYETMVEELRTLEPESQFRLIPVGHVFNDLHQLTRAGLLEGISHHSDFMLDGIHLNHRGSYVAGLTFYAVIYGADPRGMPVVSPYQITPSQAAVIQEAVWRVVSQHPQCGISTDLMVTTLSLPDSLQDAPYSTQFTAAFAQGAVTWSLAEGVLPSGLSLASNGVLSGVPTTAGFHRFTVQASDSAHTAQRQYLLLVQSNDPPRITTGVLPPAAVGTPYSFALRHTGGFGPVQWSVTTGDLPHGLRLSPDGVLSGTPTSIPGTFILTFSAADSIPATGTATMALIVQPPEDGTAVVAPLRSLPLIDGVLEPPLQELPFSLQRVLAGTPQGEVSFAARWHTDHLYLAIRLLGSPASRNPTLHLFLDGHHDRQGVFNADDRHLSIQLNGTWSERNGRTDGITLATSALPEGIAVEIRLSLPHLGRPTDGQSLSLGFDLALEEAPSGAEPDLLVWHGVDPRQPAPIDFGNLLLAAGPVARNLLLNGDFRDTNLLRPSFPAQATTAMAGTQWVANGVPARPLARVDTTGYGYPDRAINVYGESRGVCLYQVIHDARSTVGEGYLRFDLKHAAADISYRLFAYNGTAAEVDARIGVQSQQHPPSGGTPTATLLSGTLAAVPSESTWREVAIPVDFGSGYDYLIFAFSSAAVNVHVDSKIDNVQLGPSAPAVLGQSGQNLASHAGSLLQAKLLGTNPGLNLPWRQTWSLAEGIQFSGISLSPGVQGVAGNDGVHYHHDHGSTFSTLAQVLSRGHYLSFSLSVEDGTFDLAGAVFQFAMDRLNNNSTAARYAVFSNLTGFDEPSALFISDSLGTSGPQTTGFTLPQSETFRNLKQVTFRIYGFGGQYAFRTVALRGLSLGGTRFGPTPLQAAYQQWADSIQWGQADPHPMADANRNGIPNLMEFALGFGSPASAAALPQHLPHLVQSSSGSPGLRYRFSRHATESRVQLRILTSSDLRNWTEVVPDGSSFILETIPPDPGQDPSMERLQLRLPLAPANTFLRLQVVP